MSAVAEGKLGVRNAALQKASDELAAARAVLEEALAREGRARNALAAFMPLPSFGQLLDIALPSSAEEPKTLTEPERVSPLRRPSPSE